MRIPRKDPKSRRARRAIEYLFAQLSVHPEDSERIIAHARAYSLRHRVPISAQERLRFCPSCSNPYPADAKRRIRSASIYVHCPRCGALRRLRARTNATVGRHPARRRATRS